MADIKTQLQRLSPQTPTASISVAGYGAPAHIQASGADQDLAAMAALAEDILADPQALALFSDRVYGYLKQDLGLRRERNGYFNGSR
ncbi:MAG: hypothetical protein O2890_12940 [Cyanobacteria bacterium]|nr:hypothetical protein [Cyanobacteriota bacterium]MDA0867294.1 hypothetical protein [Cyanobacteriota bacterium]